MRKDLTSNSAPKTVLFSGILLLIIGILIRRLTDYPLFGLIILLTGVALKTYYILSKVRSGEYRPGRELWLLFIGLVLLFVGIYLRSQTPGSLSYLLIAVAIVLKVLFIVRFVRMTRQPKGR